MKRLGSGEHTVRNATIVGAGLLVGGVAIGWGVQRWRRSNQHPTLDMEWDPEAYPAFTMDVEREAADLSEYAGRAYRKHAALLITDAQLFDDQLSRSEGRAAIAARGVDGLWYASLVPADRELGTTEVDKYRHRAVAVPLGGAALDEVQLGVMDEQRFVPFDTNLQEVAPRRELLAAYPDVPVTGELQFATEIAVRPTEA